jgi:hypothetical protein
MLSLPAFEADSIYHGDEYQYEGFPEAACRCSVVGKGAVLYLESTGTYLS